MLAVLRSPAQRRVGVRRTAPARSGSRYAGSPSIIDVADVVVGDHLRVVEQLLDGLHRRPRRVDLREQRLPLVERAAGELARRARRRTPPRCSPRAWRSAKRGSSARSWRPIERQNVGPVAVGLEEHQLDVAAVLRAVGRRRAGSPTRRRPTSRAAAGPGARRARRRTASTWRSPSSDTSTTEPSPVRRALEQRGRDPERQRHARRCGRPWRPAG